MRQNKIKIMKYYASRVFLRLLSALGSLLPIVASNACTNPLSSYLTNPSPTFVLPYTLIVSIPNCANSILLTFGTSSPSRWIRCVTYDL